MNFQFYSDSEQEILTFLLQYFAGRQLKFSRLRSEEEVKDNMQITIETEAEKEGESSKRKVARDVDMENFTVVDEVCCRLSPRDNFPLIAILRSERWRVPKLTCQIPTPQRVKRSLRSIKLLSRRERRRRTGSPQKAETSVS